MLSSYCITLMVVHFLQCGIQPAVLPSVQEFWPPAFDSDGRPRKGLLLEVRMFEGWGCDQWPRTERVMSDAALIRKFFEYFEDFSFDSIEMDIRSSAAREYIPANNSEDAALMRIVDPFIGDNVARAVRHKSQIKAVRDAFARARHFHDMIWA
ncbi:Protein F31C3.2 a [Aphelenchoides avenae]|nr:Protein F31C3.2 a [Aphelenchus avenae]